MMRAAAVATLIALLLAGCSSDKATDPDAGANDPETGPASDATSYGSVPAPTWKVGQWWEWELSFGTTTRPDTFRSIVVAADGSSYDLATENTDWAKEEAAFDHPLLGPVTKSDLVLTGPGGDWSLLSFPLADGKTWTASMPNIAWDVFLPAERVDIDMTATFSRPPAGEPPAVTITGTSGDLVLIEAEYDAASGWFSALRFYDVDPGQEELEVGYQAKAAGLDYTGPYFQHTARSLLQVTDMNGFDEDPTAGGQPMTAPPQPYHAFTAVEGTTLYGYVVAETVVALRAVVLVDPNNQERHLESHGDVNGAAAAFFMDEPAIAGEWRLATAGAGGFSGAFAEIFEVTEGSFTL